MLSDDQFLAALRNDPQDHCLRLAYADWLEQQGDPRGLWLRLDHAVRSEPAGTERRDQMRARQRDLAPEIDPNWLAEVDRTEIRNCLVQAEPHSPCPRQWQALPRGDHPRLRSCQHCEQDVLYCTRYDDLAEFENAAEGPLCAASHTGLDFYLQSLQLSPIMNVLTWIGSFFLTGPRSQAEGASKD